VLPVVTILWTNLHGGFFVGAILIAAYGGGEVLTLLFGGSFYTAEARVAVRRRALGYLSFAGGRIGSRFLYPFPCHPHAHMAMYLRDPFNSEHIREFLSPSFHHPSAIFFEAMLLLAAPAACWTLSQGSFTESIFLAAWAHGAFLAARNIPIFLIVAALPAA